MRSRVFIPLLLGVAFLWCLSMLRPDKEGAAPQSGNTGSPSLAFDESREAIAGEPVPKVEMEGAKIPVGHAPFPNPEVIFRRLLAKYREAPSMHSDMVIAGRFGYGNFTHDFIVLREGRLFALAFPEEGERLARATAVDPAVQFRDREFAIYLLSVGAAHGRKGAENGLYELCFVADEQVSQAAFGRLSQIDTTGAYRSLYWKRCSEGNLDAFEPVSLWAGIGSEGLLREITQRKAGPYFPEAEIPLLAQRALDRLAILTSPDWESQLEAVLRGRRWNVGWALRAARLRGMKSLPAYLRERLDAGMIKARSDPWFLEGYPLGGGVRTSTQDFFYDEILVTYSELGGDLSDLERRRMRAMGYLCDPKERLAELIPGR